MPSLILPSPKMPSSKLPLPSQDNLNNKSLQIDKDMKVLINNRIETIESELNKNNKQQTEIIEAFFKRSGTSCNPLICQDLFNSSTGSYGQDTELKLKGGGTDNLKVKRFTSNINDINIALNALRSSCMFNSSGNHEKCSSKTFCNFCLLRSLVFKINMPKGRLLLQPVEAEYQLNETDSMSIVEILEKFLNNASQSNLSFSNVIKPAWTCSCCRKKSLVPMEV